MKSVTLLSVLILSIVFGATEAFRQQRCLRTKEYGCNPNTGIFCCDNKICAKGDFYPGTCVDEQHGFSSIRIPSRNCLASGQYGCNPNAGRNCCAGKICSKGDFYPGTCVDETRPINYI